MAVSLITEEMVEKATSAANAVYGDDDINPEEVRAALNAILPDIVETCARVADKESGFAKTEPVDNCCSATAWMVAKRIRALAPVRPE